MAFVGEAMKDMLIQKAYSNLKKKRLFVFTKYMLLCFAWYP